MRTLTANNYQQAFSQLKAIDEQSAAKLEEVIYDSNKKHFNIILVRKMNDDVRQRYLTTFVVQAFNIRQWEKLQKNYSSMGYSNVIVLHNPYKKVEPASEPAPKEPKQAPKEAISEAFDVDTARVAELREFAEDNGIEIAEGDLKADIKSKVKAWQEELVK